MAVRAMTNGKGVLVNCTSARPSGFAAMRISPAISGASRLARHTAWPSRTVQPGAARSTDGKSGTARHPARPKPKQNKLNTLENFKKLDDMHGFLRHPQGKSLVPEDDASETKKNEHQSPKKHQKIPKTQSRTA